MKKNYLSNEKMLQDFGVLFLNLAKESELKNAVEEYGYNSDKIAKGKTLYDKANELYLKNKKDSSNEIDASANYRKKIDGLLETYMQHRKKAKIVFKEQQEVMKKLSLSGSLSRNKANLLKEIEILYINLKEDEKLLNEVKVMKITNEEVENQIQNIEKVRELYADYLKMKAESQQATKDKDKAFSELDKWVKEFYAVAEIALEDKQQLLEGVGKLIKS